MLTHACICATNLSIFSTITLHVRLFFFSFGFTRPAARPIPIPDSARNSRTPLARLKGTNLCFFASGVKTNIQNQQGTINTICTPHRKHDLCSHGGASSSAVSHHNKQTCITTISASKTVSNPTPHANQLPSSVSVADSSRHPYVRLGHDVFHSIAVATPSNTKLRCHSRPPCTTMHDAHIVLASSA